MFRERKLIVMYRHSSQDLEFDKFVFSSNFVKTVKANV